VRKCLYRENNGAIIYKSTATTDVTSTSLSKALILCRYPDPTTPLLQAPRGAMGKDTTTAALALTTV